MKIAAYFLDGTYFQGATKVLSDSPGLSGMTRRASVGLSIACPFFQAFVIPLFLMIN